MTLVVRDPFHLGGVMKQIGDELTAAEEKAIADEKELLHRCVRRAEAAVEAVAAASVAALKKADPKPEA